MSRAAVLSLALGALLVAVVADARLLPGTGTNPLNAVWARDLSDTLATQDGVSTGVSPNGDILVVISGHGQLVATTVNTGLVLWTHTLAQYGRAPVVAVTNEVVVTSFMYRGKYVLHALSARTGSQLWTSNATSNDGVGLASGNVYGDIVVGIVQTSGNYVGISASTGATIWNHAPPTETATPKVADRQHLGIVHRGDAVLVRWVTTTTNWQVVKHIALLKIATGHPMYVVSASDATVLSVDASDYVVIRANGVINVVDWASGTSAYTLTASQMSEFGLTNAPAALFRNNSMVFTDAQTFVRSLSFNPTTKQAVSAGFTTINLASPAHYFFATADEHPALVLQSLEIGSSMFNLTAFDVVDAYMRWQIVHPNSGYPMVPGFWRSASPGPSAVYVPASTIGEHSPATVWSAADGSMLWSGTDSIDVSTVQGVPRHPHHHAELLYVGLANASRLMAFTVSVA